MAPQPAAILAYGYNLGDPNNDWLFEGHEDDDDFFDEVDALIEGQPGVTLALHAYGDDGKALVLAGRSYSSGYGWNPPVDPETLVVDAADRQLVIDAARALGLTFPSQPDGPGWLLLVSLDE